MTQYLSVLANQTPFATTVDDNNRTIYSMNFSATAVEPVTQFENEIQKILQDAALATPWNGTTGDTFIGPAAVIPVGNGPYTLINNTGGIAPLETHNGKKYARLSAQITVRAKSSAVAYARAWAIWRALDGKRNLAVVAT